MELAALLIAVAALVLATVSVTLQVTLYFIKKKEEGAARHTEYVMSDFLSPSENEMVVRPNKDAAKEDKRLQDAFDNPDVPYTGIDEEFNV